MIDTDKYEGHTEGKWIMGEYKGRPSIHAGDETFVRSIARGLNPSQTADHALLLDAPLLLAEVKRLRGVIAQVWNLMQNSNHQDREAYFWGFDGKNTGWMKVHEELAMRELNWGEEE